MDIRAGQTYRLLSGEVVTVVTAPDKAGRLEALSHDAARVVDHEAGVKYTYHSFAFQQAGVELLEARLAPRVADLRTLIREVVEEVLDERDGRRPRPARLSRGRGMMGS